ncbi:hypothetical protein BX666DRAFT_1942285 [Dichotomocladium elegans]|nr:hypothetical protein BX666DRAFT_1942285 [Dichotomocladium elegans]
MLLELTCCLALYPVSISLCLAVLQIEFLHRVYRIKEIDFLFKRIVMSHAKTFHTTHGTSMNTTYSLFSKELRFSQFQRSTFESPHSNTSRKEEREINPTL